MKPLLSLVVPVYFEEDCVDTFIDQVQHVLDPMNLRYEFVFIDDGSTDRTCEIIRNRAHSDDRIKLIEFSYNHGKQAAVTAGIGHARGDYLLYMDPDLQDPPREIPRFVEEIAKGVDVVYGVRREKKDSVLNTLYSRFFWWILRKFTGLPIPPGLAVMRIFNRRFADAFLQYKEQNRFIEGIFMHVGMHASTLQIDQDRRYAGVSKFNLRRKLNLATDAILDFSEMPLKSTVKIGIVLSLFGFFGILAVTTLSFFGFVNQAGWASILSLILLAFGVQLFFLGIIALYVGRIYRETKGRPLYSIRSMTNMQSALDDRQSATAPNAKDSSFTRKLSSR